MLESPAVDLCLMDPGYDVDLDVRGHIRTMVDYWMGDVELADAVRSGALRVEGPRRLVREFASWFTRSPFAQRR